MDVFIEDFRNILLKCEFYANFGQAVKHDASKRREKQ